MTLRIKQIFAGVLAVSAANVGGWAQFAPRSFHDSFPGLGHHWVAPLGPYNEHLIRDVGGLYLALFTLSAWAALRPRSETFALAGVGWLVFSIPHLVFHLAHLDMYRTSDKVGNVVSLGAIALFAALLLVPSRTMRPRLSGKVS